MKLIKYHHTKISDEKAVAGLVNGQIEYEVKGARGQLEYSGPKFSPQLWHQILSFFRWTNKEHHSECQVRLYVNVPLGKWGAWAFPQAARTGMTAKELPIQETPDQARARFASWQSEPTDDWLYFGTVHHHCSASAFQSSTDEQNEWNQDGLHITVGRMDQDRHDLHARFYLGGNAYEPDLSCFWSLAAELAEQVPASIHHQLAAHQMGAKVTVDFPDQWRHHLVESAPEPRSLVPQRHWDMDDLHLPLMTRVDEALEDIHHQCGIMSVKEEEWLADLQLLAANEVLLVILGVCIQHQVTPDALLEGVSQSMLEY
jgi:hypothetical protein